LTGGAKRLSIYYSGRDPTGKKFFAGGKSPFTNTAKSTLFCSPKVNISLLFTEDLQNGEILGEICIKFRIDREMIAGIYYDILERRGVAARGCGTTICRGMGSRRNSRPSW
jgi:hypothetical protein